MGSSREQFNFLFSTRSAPLQIFWSQGNLSYHVNGIDKRIMQGISGDEDYSYKDFDFSFFASGISKDFYDPPIDLSAVDKIKKSYPKDYIILGRYWSYDKIR